MTAFVLLGRCRITGEQPFLPIGLPLPVRFLCLSYGRNLICTYCVCVYTDSNGKYRNRSNLFCSFPYFNCQCHFFFAISRFYSYILPTSCYFDSLPLTKRVVFPVLCNLTHLYTLKTRQTIASARKTPSLVWERIWLKRLLSAFCLKKTSYTVNNWA